MTIFLTVCVIVLLVATSAAGGYIFGLQSAYAAGREIERELREPAKSADIARRPAKSALEIYLENYPK